MSQQQDTGPAILSPAPSAIPPSKLSLQPPPTPILTQARAATPLQHQVAGHANVMSDESGSLVIKPAAAREIAFYNAIAGAPSSQPISKLRPFLAKMYGTLRLQGRIDPAAGVVPVPGSGDEESIVLENLTYRFTSPCVLDAKLGTALHGPDASPEKAARMAKKAAETTSGETGLRLTGCQVWHEPSATFIQTPREFGYNLTVARMPEGMKRFFPLPDDDIEPLEQPGPATSQNGNFNDHRLPPRLTSRLLGILDDELARMEAVFNVVELHAVGMSVLVVYEGDPARLEAAFKRYDAKRVSQAAKSLASASGGHKHGNWWTQDSHAFWRGSQEENRIAVGGKGQLGSGPGAKEGMDYEEQLSSGGESDDAMSDESSDSESESDDADDDDDDDGRKEDERRARRCPPISVNLIDFAHTHIADGEGPDTGVLLGLRTLRSLVQGRKVEVDAWVPKDGEKKQESEQTPA